MAQLQQITFETDNPCLIALIEAGRPGSVNLGSGGRTHELYNSWGFHVETFRDGQKRNVLIEKLPNVEIEAAFQQNVSLIVRTHAGTQKFEHIRTIHIDGNGNVSSGLRQGQNPQQPGSQSVPRSEPQPTPQPEPQSTPQPEPQLIPQPEPQPITNTTVISRLTRSLEECRAKLNEANAERDELKRKNDQLEAQNHILQNSLSGQLTNLEHSLAEESLRLDTSLQEALNRVRTKQEQNEQLRRSLEEAEAEADSILGLRDDLHMEMDVAQERLDEIRDCLGADSDILTLMQEEPFLKGKSVQKLLDEAEKTLNRAEQRLGAVVLLRERINSALLNTILTPSEDGTVPLRDEFGGDHNGICGNAEASN